MRIPAAALALALTFALGSAALAATTTNTLKGKFARNDSNSKIAIKVQTGKKGVPVKIVSFDISGADAECLDEAENSLTRGPELTAKLGSFKITTLKLPGQKAQYRFSASKAINGIKHDITGSVSANSRSATGSFRSNPTTKCGIPENSFTAKK